MSGRETSGIHSLVALRQISLASLPTSPATRALQSPPAGLRRPRPLKVSPETARASGRAGWPPWGRPHAKRTTRRPPSAGPSSSTAVTAPPPRPPTTTAPVVSPRRPLLWVRSLLVAWDLGRACGFGFRGWREFQRVVGFRVVEQEIELNWGDEMGGGEPAWLR
jgi:hypothetical protein